MRNAGLFLLATVCLAAAGRAADDPAVQAFLAGDLAAAQKSLEKEVGAPTAGASRRLLLGRIYFMRENWPAARTTLEKLLKDEPSHPEASELLGRTLFRLGSYSNAVPRMEKAVSETRRPELRLELAECLLETGRGGDALAQLKPVLEDRQVWPRAHYLFGRLRLDSGVGHWASQHLWIALQTGCREKDLRMLLARAYHMEGRITGPLQVTGPIADGRSGLRTADRILVRPVGPARPAWWFAAGVDTALYQVEAALEEARAAEAAGDALAARCWLAAGVPDAAAPYVARLKEDTADNALLRAELALARGDWAACAREARREGAAAVSPDASVQLLLQAVLLAQVKGDMPAVLDMLQAADHIQPGRSDVLRIMVDALARVGRQDEARSRVRLLTELHPDSPVVRGLAGRYGVITEPGEVRP